MVHMSEWMRAASSEAPPSGISVDALIARERRRTLRWRLTGGVVVIAAAASLIPFASSALSPPVLPPVPHGAAAPAPVCPTVDLKKTPEPGPQQSHPAPRPTEPCGTAASRLTSVLSAALNADVPGFRWNTKRLQYETLAELPGGAKVQVRIIAGHEYSTDRATSPCPEGAEWSCTYELTGDKTVVTAVDTGQGTQAEGYRKDGTMVLLLATGAALTPDRAAAIVGDAGLTLFP